MHWYTDVLKKYVEFSGRARRQEYWMFFLISFIISTVLSGIDRAIGTNSSSGGLLQGIYGLAVLLPTIAVNIRRLHDTNRSGWWVLLWLIPILGWIPVIVFLAQDGTPGDNKYGPDPKAAERGGAVFPGGEPGYPTV
jgi:uncharacterized membrane protein YhaH (DUF805 family)